MAASTRPIVTTLMSCATTLALSVASVCGDPTLTDLKLRRPKAYRFFLALAFLFPWIITTWRVFYMLIVWSVDIASLHKITVEPHHRDADNKSNILSKLRSSFRARSKFGIIAVCPLIIPVPDLGSESESTAVSDKEMIQSMVDRGECERLDRSTLEKHCPLLMTPGKASSTNVMRDISQYYSVNSGDMENPTATTGTNQTKGQYLYFKLDEELRVRTVLLELGLVPPYKQLCFARTRGRLDTIVTVLQALGFVLGLADRVRQSLVFSPMEALVSIFAVMAVVQRGLDLFGSCGSFRTPIVLSLSPSQFRRFIHHPRPSIARSLNDVQRLLVGVLVGVFVGAVPALLEVLYSSYFRVSQTTRASSSQTTTASSNKNSTVFQMYSVLTCVVSVFTLGVLRRDRPWFRPAASLVVVATLTVFCLALYCTITDWKFYKEAGDVDFSLAWLLPHVYAN